MADDSDGIPGADTDFPVKTAIVDKVLVFRQVGGQIFSRILVENSSTKNAIIFLVRPIKSSNYAKYNIRPHLGIIKPGDSARVQVDVMTAYPRTVNFEMLEVCVVEIVPSFAPPNFPPTPSPDFRDSPIHLHGLNIYWKILEDHGVPCSETHRIACALRETVVREANRARLHLPKTMPAGIRAVQALDKLETGCRCACPKDYAAKSYVTGQEFNDDMARLHMQSLATDPILPQTYFQQLASQVFRIGAVALIVFLFATIRIILTRPPVFLNIELNDNVPPNLTLHHVGLVEKCGRDYFQNMIAVDWTYGLGPIGRMLAIFQIVWQVWAQGDDTHCTPLLQIVNA